MQIKPLFLAILITIALNSGFKTIAQIEMTASAEPTAAIETIDFDLWFIPKTLRVDYLLTGDANSEVACFLNMKQEPSCGGVRQGTNRMINIGRNGKGDKPAFYEIAFWGV